MSRHSVPPPRDEWRSTATPVHAGNGNDLDDLGKTLASMTDEEKRLARYRWVAFAYSKLPGLSDEEKALAKDKRLAAECSLWRLQYREERKEREHQERRASMLEQRLAALEADLERITRSLTAAHVQFVDTSAQTLRGTTPVAEDL